MNSNTASSLVTRRNVTGKAKHGKANLLIPMHHEVLSTDSWLTPKNVLSNPDGATEPGANALPRQYEPWE